MWCKLCLLVLFLVHHRMASVWGFPLELGRRVFGGTRNSTFLDVPDDQKQIIMTEQEFYASNQSADDTNAILNFQGEFSHYQHITWSPMTMWSTRRLYIFFQNRVHRNLLLKGGGNPTEEIPWTPELMEEWATQARVVSSTPPTMATTTPMTFGSYGHGDEHHSVVAIYSTVPIVPGLFIKAISYMGCKLLPHPQTLLPMYEFTLIQDQYQAEGTKPLVWLYRKITGEATMNKKVVEDRLVATHGLCRVFLEPFRSHGANEALRLSYYSMVKVSCNLPQRLLKMLPLSKQSIEAKISASMVKQLETEVMQSADKFHTALEAFLQQSHDE